MVLYFELTHMQFNSLQLYVLQHSSLDRIKLSCLHAKSNTRSRSSLLSKLQVEGEDEEIATSKAIFVDQCRIDEGTLESRAVTCRLHAVSSCSELFLPLPTFEPIRDVPGRVRKCSSVSLSGESEFQVLQTPISLPTSSKRCRSSSSFCLSRQDLSHTEPY